MLYYDTTDVNEGIDPTRSSKTKNAWFVTIFYMDLNFKSMYAMVVMTWQC